MEALAANAHIMADGDLQTCVGGQLNSSWQQAVA
jgi:hypothetical protein